jgi:hypothetical protein
LLVALLGWRGGLPRWLLLTRGLLTGGLLRTLIAALDDDSGKREETDDCGSDAPKGAHDV